jgi:4'-phosphopantetheinyl transferase
MSHAPEINWPVPEQFPVLGTREIHLWCGWLDRGDGEAAADYGCLSADETDRARSFHFAADRNRYITARLYLRRLLGHYLERDPARLVFNYGRYGKPTLVHQAALAGPQDPAITNLTFNQSHCGPLWLAAVAWNQPVGVDVEEVKDLSDLELVEARMFSPPELTRQQALPLDLRRAEFFRRWTQREAAAKFHGLGLEFSADRPVSVAAPDQVESLAPAAGYLGCLAYGGAPVRLRRLGWSTSILSGPGQTEKSFGSTVRALLPFLNHGAAFCPRPMPG